jgi:hypothetical protein
MIKALRLGLSPWSFRVLAELFTVRETEGLRCATFNDLDWKCFLPLANHTEKALVELEQCGVIRILRRVDGDIPTKVRKTPRDLPQTGYTQRDRSFRCSHNQTAFRPLILGA